MRRVQPRRGSIRYFPAIGEPGDNPSPRGPDPIRVARVWEHSFLAAPITAESTIVDLGMNTGEFATTMIAHFGCSVVGVEPVPDLFAEIPQVPGLTAEHRAVTPGGETVPLFLSSNPLGATIDDRRREADQPAVMVTGTTLGNLLDRHDIARTPLVKVDVEGAELEMLHTITDRTLQRIDQLTVEFHDFLDPGQAGEVRRVKQRLASAGFAEMAFSTDNKDVLFVNTAHVPFTAAHRAAIALFYKYPRGIRRNIQRRIDDRRAARGR